MQTDILLRYIRKKRTQAEDYATDKELTLEGQSENPESVKLCRTVHTSNDGQYRLTVKTSTSKTLYARGFLVYMDDKGNIVVVYTDIQTASV